MGLWNLYTCSTQCTYRSCKIVHRVQRTHARTQASPTHTHTLVHTHVTYLPTLPYRALTYPTLSCLSACLYIHTRTHVLWDKFITLQFTSKSCLLAPLVYWLIFRIYRHVKKWKRCGVTCSLVWNILEHWFQLCLRRFKTCTLLWRSLVLRAHQT